MFNMFYEMSNFKIELFNNYCIINNEKTCFTRSLNGEKSTCKTRKNAIVEYLDYQIPVTQLMGPKGNGDMQAAKRD